MTNYGLPLRFKAVDASGMTPQKRYGVKPVNVLKRIYLEQSRKDRRENIDPPNYTQEQLIQRFINDPKYIVLYNNWVDSGFQKSLKPSIDRIDSSKGYSINNIQIMTWSENRKKGDKEKSKTSVHCYTKEGVYLRTFTSVKDASEKTSCSISGINACCNLRRGSNNGYTFRYAGVFAREKEKKKYSHLVHTPPDELKKKAEEVLSNAQEKA